MYCCHISRSLVKTTLRIVGQQIREKNMTSYYVDGILSTFTAAASLIPKVDRASCSSARVCSSDANVASPPPSLSGVYSGHNNSAGLHGSPTLTPGYSHCSQFDQSRRSTDSCCHPWPGPLSSPPDKRYRIYPWMRASGILSVFLFFFFNASGSAPILNIGMLTLTVSASINFLKPLVLHGKES